MKPSTRILILSLSLGLTTLSSLTTLTACQAPTGSPRPANTTVIQTAPVLKGVIVPRAMPGMSFDGKIFWQYKPFDATSSTPTEPARLFRFSLSGELLGTTPLSRRLGDHKSLAWGLGHLWLLDYANRLHKIKAESGEVLATIELKNLGGQNKAEQIVFAGDALWVLEKNYPLSPGVEQPPRFSRIDTNSGQVFEHFEISHPGFDALFENLASDGEHFYLAKHNLYTAARNQIFRIHARSHKVEVKPLKRVYGNIPTLVWHQGNLIIGEQIDVLACPNGCRGLLFSFDFNADAPATARPPGIVQPSPPPGAPRPPGGTPPSIDQLALAPYLLPVQEAFKLMAENEPHQAEISRERLAFERDLEAGRTGEYERIPSFSILLAAGSEGSFLNPGAATGTGSSGQLAAGSEGSFVNPSANPNGSQLAAGSEGNYFDQGKNLDKLPAPQAGYAKALIFAKDKPVQVVKGQFAKGRFYFQGVPDLASENQTYLIALDASLQVQVFLGKLIPGNLNQPQQLPVAQADAASPELESRFAQAIARFQTERKGYQDMVSRQNYVPTRNLPPMMRSQVLIRLLEDFPEVATDIYEIFGLPPVPFDHRIRALSAFYKQRYPSYFSTASADDPFANPPMRGRPGIAPSPPP